MKLTRINQEIMIITNKVGITELTQAEIEALHGVALLEFGAVWCAYCQAAQPVIASALVDYPNTLHIKIEDAKGRRLGRLYAVKLWPTLIFLKDGVEQKRLVRPIDPQVIIAALVEINIE